MEPKKKLNEKWLCHSCISHAHILLGELYADGRTGVQLEFTSEHCDCPCHSEEE